ncbi:MAG TPA: PD-(D/E)XK nuclease family protein, partial [Bacillota bacterium]|nr:PD-(D/E)XK nuclease family protein [Bacillota bacterium]
LAHPTEDGSFTLVQGMIDCWFVDDDGQAVLIDYKSDRLSGTYEERVDTLRNKYAVQLDTYAKAITAATGKIVKEKTIWSIEDACAYSL